VKLRRLQALGRRQDNAAPPPMGRMEINLRCHNIIVRTRATHRAACGVRGGDCGLLGDAAAQGHHRIGLHQDPRRREKWSTKCDAPCEFLICEPIVNRAGRSRGNVLRIVPRRFWRTPVAPSRDEPGLLTIGAFRSMPDRRMSITEQTTVSSWLPLRHLGRCLRLRVRLVTACYPKPRTCDH